MLPCWPLDFSCNLIQGGLHGQDITAPFKNLQMWLILQYRVEEGRKGMSFGKGSPGLRPTGQKDNIDCQGIRKSILL